MRQRAADYGMWLNDRLGAATKWRPILYPVGWALIGAALVAAFNSFTVHPPPSWKGRVSGEFLLFHVGFITIAIAMALSLVMAMKHRRWRFLLGPALNAPFVILTVLSGQLFAANFPDPVCGREGGCFVLGFRPTINDVVFEIWQAPCAYSHFLTRLETRIGMNTSEDGSYLSNPHLLLSGNERILVVAGGGYLVDAIEISSGRIMSDFVSWNEPDREAAMLKNSEAIRRLLDENK